METLLQRFGIGRGRDAAAAADIDWHNVFGYDSTPLSEAVRNGHAGCVRSLLAFGANPKKPNASGVFPLHEAALVGRADVLQMLLEAGATIDCKDDGDCTPLHYASRDGHALCVSALLRHKADPNAQSSTGETPLVLGVEFGNSDCTRLLLEAGADVNKREKSAMTALHVAARHGRYYYRDCTVLLLRSGAQLEARYKGRTPLHEACLRGNHGQARLLLEHGADIEAREGHSGMTPLHCAVMAEEGEECVRLLLSFSANVNALDGSGTRTVLSLARHRGASPRVMEMLIAAGVDVANDSRRPPQDPRYVNARALACLETFAEKTAADQESTRLRYSIRWRLMYRRPRRRHLLLWGASVELEKGGGFDAYRKAHNLRRGKPGGRR